MLKNNRRDDYDEKKIHQLALKQSASEQKEHEHSWISQQSPQHQLLKKKNQITKAKTAKVRPFLEIHCRFREMNDVNSKCSTNLSFV
jgi:hypothetical protein